MKRPLAALLALGTLSLAAPDARPLSDFLLEASDGQRVHLVAEDAARRCTVLWIAALDCAATRTLAPTMGELARAQAPRGVRFLAIDPAAADDALELQAFAHSAKLDFPLLRDPLQAVCERLGVTTTATALLLDREFVELARFDLASAQPLADAIAAVLVAQPIASSAASDDDGTSAGVALTKLRPAAPAAPTFFRDVAPILWTRCVECHHPGDIGPMSFLDGAETRGWAPQIAEVVADGRMPPWHADPRYGHFTNERSLTDTEKRTLHDWNASGAALGDASDAPPAPRFDSAEWSIGTPDVVVELPAPQPIPAEGVVPYRYVPVDPHFTEDRLVQAIEVRPGNREVTHHIGVFLLPPGLNQRVLNPNLLFAGSAPGGRPIELADGMAKRVARGTRFLFQLHYTPNGKATTDRTRMALRFARAPVTREVANWTIANPKVELEPFAADTRFTRTEPFREPILVTALMPHMHWRGHAFRIELARVDGTRRILLDVPRYDFGWQHTYELRDPLRLEPGDELVLNAAYDNSAANPRNPDPSQRVHVGEQTSDEMMVAYVDYVKLK